jgi:hypothetical protein
MHGVSAGIVAVAVKTSVSDEPLTAGDQEAARNGCSDSTVGLKASRPLPKSGSSSITSSPAEKAASDVNDTLISQPTPTRAGENASDEVVIAPSEPRRKARVYNRITIPSESAARALQQNACFLVGREIRQDCLRLNPGFPIQTALRRNRSG